MSIAMIACVDSNYGIGYRNELLVRIEEDMKHFKQVTTSGKNKNIVLMGRLTHESIGQPLSGRVNIVLTKNTEYRTFNNCFTYNSLEDVLKEYKNYSKEEVNLWVVGGSEIYNQALPYANEIYLTVVHKEFEKVDSYFPNIGGKEDWKLTEISEVKRDKESDYLYHFSKYERVKEKA